ncbi:large conductance mechanosensitive channel protein MscL [Neolewinella aurantiaca]|uniref:Large-conductance mechanosensitive channel n=1 Tax=Neolewinella aurantiaca TaxID=2602767 RepID=A0A5C7FKW4_9BACT|nr:large conductance mechanosensitive channel protein MscL [Neolewinella aurantiaca]TXF86719.1 large conductance mechanosensitive channel protein MscL [Neolewinella aurantiaca]
MIQEFKDFIMKGNVLELAVAVIIAGAFGAVVTSFTNDIILPPIGQAMGGVDFSELKYMLSEDVVAEDGTVTAGAAIRYGNFIQMIINFLIIAFILFLIVKAYNKATEEPAVEEAPAPDPGPSDNDLLKEILAALKK